MRLFIAVFIFLCSPLPGLKAQAPCHEVGAALIQQLKFYGATEQDTLRQMADSLLAVAEDCGEDSLYAAAYTYRGEAFYFASALDSSIANYQKAKLYYEQLGDTPQAMLNTFNLANCFSEQGQVNLATEYYLTTLNHFQEEQDTPRMALTHYNLSLLLFDQDNLAAAERQLHKSQNLLVNQKKQQTIYPDVLQMLGHLHYLQGKTDSARMLLRESLQYTDTVYYEDYKAYAYANFAMMHMDAGQLDSARYYIDAAVSISTERQDAFSRASYLGIAGEVAAKQGNLPLAQAKGDTMLSIARSMGSLVLLEQAYDLLADFFSDAGEYESAYAYLDSSVSIHDSLITQNAETALYNFEREIRVKENEALAREKMQVQEEAALRQQQLKERSVLLLIIGILLLLLTVALGYLIILNRKRKRLNDAKDTILSVISHDLRGPIVQMKSLSDLLLGQKQSQEQQLAILHHFHIAISNLQKSFENILFWSKSQMQGISVNPVAVNVHRAIQEVLAFHQQSIRAKQLSLDLQLSDTPQVRCDANQLQVVFRNVISNAIKFSHKGGVLHISANREEGSIYIRIRDEGIGIEEKELRKILNRNIQFTRIGTTNEKGTGLGLILSRKFIQANRGTFDMESEPGVGTTIIICLPEA